ncbi:IS5/IS1182 family transposase, partial [Kineococcus sp. LSe6-4]
RLARDYERTVASAVAMVQIAYSRVMLRRLTRSAPSTL